LQQETARPPAGSLAAQGRRFRAFVRVYNEERPHEALGMAVPASLYAASPRVWSGRLRSPEYGGDVAVRRVRTNGEMKWRNALVYVSSALIGEPVGIEETDDGTWQVSYGPVPLGILDPSGKLRRPPAKGMRRQNESVTHHAG
jgi:hypothetical protein